MPSDRSIPARGAEHYLGDGLYVSFDGWGVWLRAPREGGDHRVCLDPSTYRAMRAWVGEYAELKKHMGE